VICNHFEVEVLRIIGKYFKVEDPAGYITSGGTEGNLAGIWWSKLYLINQNSELINNIQKSVYDYQNELKSNKSISQENYREMLKAKKTLKKLKNPFMIMAEEPHTHYSAAKCANLLQLNIEKI